DGHTATVVERTEGHRGRALVLTRGRKSPKEPRAAALTKCPLRDFRGRVPGQRLVIVAVDLPHEDGHPRPARPALAHLAVADTRKLGPDIAGHEAHRSTHALAAAVHGRWIAWVRVPIGA